MSHTDRCAITLSGMVTKNVLYRPGRILRFTLAGSTIQLTQPERELIYYQEVFIPGARADQVRAMLREGHSYLVEGTLVSSQGPQSGGEDEGEGERERDGGTQWRVMAFSVLPIHRRATTESAAGHKRLEDAMSHSLALGNLARDPVVVRNQYGTMTRAVIAVNSSKRGSQERSTSWIHIKVDDTELAESLAQARKGDRLLVMGQLFTERYTAGGQQVRQTTLMAHGIEFIGALEGDEDAPEADAPALQEA